MFSILQDDLRIDRLIATMVRTYIVKSQKERILTFLTKNPVFVEAAGEKNWRLCNGHQEVTNSQIDDEYVGWSLKAPAPTEIRRNIAKHCCTVNDAVSRSSEFTKPRNTTW